MSALLPLCSFERLHPQLLRMITAIGIQASDAHHFQAAVFGRDSLVVGRDVVRFAPWLARDIIISLARVQGLRHHEMSEEEPGRIHHEYRTRYIGGAEVPADIRRVTARLIAKWHLPPGDEAVIYSTIDATVLYILLIHEYIGQCGPEILRTVIRHRSGATFTLQASLKAAVGWLVRRVAASDLGLVEFCRTNPYAHAWQVMRDGATAYLHEDGGFANFTAPIAAIEVQGLAYDALMLGGHGDLANQLRRTTLERFWMPDRNQFAMALDRDAGGNVRQVGTASSAPAELLATGLFEGIKDGRDYVTAIVRQMLSDEFLTPVGIRMRGRSYAGLASYWEYQGSCTSWYNVSNQFAIGLRRWGLVDHARFIENLMRSGINRTGTPVEYSYVDIDGAVNYDPTSRTGQLVAATNIPESAQAWTVSAGLRILHDEDTRTNQGAWQRALSAELLPAASRLLSAAPKRTFQIDLERGKRREKAKPFVPKP